MSEILTQDEIDNLLDIVPKMSRLTINVTNSGDIYVQDLINKSLANNNIIIENIVSINDYISNDIHRVFVYYKEYVKS